MSTKNEDAVKNKDLYIHVLQFFTVLHSLIYKKKKDENKIKDFFYWKNFFHLYINFCTLGIKENYRHTKKFYKTNNNIIRDEGRQMQVLEERVIAKHEKKN